MKRFYSPLNAKESITIGIFTAIILFFHLTLLMALHFLPGALILFKEAIVAAATAPVYVLLLAKVPKRGVFSICGIAIGISYTLFGFFTVGITTILGGFMADAILKRDEPQSFFRNLTAYIVFTIGKVVGTYIPIYLWADSFIKGLVETGKANPEFIDLLVQSLTPTMAVYILAANCLGAIFGFQTGKKLMQRHFTRAGILDG